MPYRLFLEYKLAASLCGLYRHSGGKHTIVILLKHVHFKIARSKTLPNSWKMAAEPENQALIDYSREYRLFLVDTIKELEEKFTQIQTIVASRLLPAEQLHDFCQILTNLNNFKNKAVEELKRLDTCDS